MVVIEMPVTKGRNTWRASFWINSGGRKSINSLTEQFRTASSSSYNCYNVRGCEMTCVTKAELPVHMTR